jgi:hypothetical protein
VVVGWKQEKGFEVKILDPCPLMAVLTAELANANQLWLISASSAVLSDEHVEVIVEQWRSGMGMCVGVLCRVSRRKAHCTVTQSSSACVRACAPAVVVGDAVFFWALCASREAVHFMLGVTVQLPMRLHTANLPRAIPSHVQVHLW